MKYDCTCNIGPGINRWTASIDPISHKRSFFEVTISGRKSSFHVITGPQSNGHFLCIPDWEIGCEIKSYDDIPGNILVLGRHLSPIDSITVSNGLPLLLESFKNRHVLL